MRHNYFPQGKRILWFIISYFLKELHLNLVSMVPKVVYIVQVNFPCSITESVNLGGGAALMSTRRVSY